MNEDNGPIYAAINSFGYGGTNAHAILQEAPPAVSSNIVEKNPKVFYLLLLSARDKSALRELAESYVALLESSDALELTMLLFRYTASRTSQRAGGSNR